jgi:DNA-binding PadR family transcriptional regulator
LDSEDDTTLNSDNLDLVLDKAVDNWEVEIRRGVIVLLVLASLLDGDLNGKDIIAKISSRTNNVIHVPLGTIYPLLRRFNKSDMIETYKPQDPAEDARQTMYRINKRGKIFFKQARDLFLRYTSAAHAFIDKVDENTLGDVY